MIKRPHWSYSQIAQYLRWPMQYYFERIVKLPRIFTSSNLLFGSAIHASIAKYHEELKHGEILLIDPIRTVFINTWSGAESERPISYGDGKSRSEFLDLGETILTTYLASPPPIDIVGVEVPLTVPLINSAGNYLAKPLTAVLDLLCQNEEGIEVREFKTSARKYGEREVDNALQATCYAHAVNQRTDEVPKLQYVVFVKTKTPSIQNISVSRTDYDFGRLGDLVESIDHAIANGVFYPNESPMNCSGCNFRFECLAWQGHSGIQATEREKVLALTDDRLAVIPS